VKTGFADSIVGSLALKRTLEELDDLGLSEWIGGLECRDVVGPECVEVRDCEPRRVGFFDADRPDGNGLGREQPAEDRPRTGPQLRASDRHEPEREDQGDVREAVRIAPIVPRLSSRKTGLSIRRRTRGR